MILLDLIHNVALLVALSVVFPLVVRRWGSRSLTGQVVAGLLFGAVVLIGMMTPVDIGGGVIFDGRSIVLCAAGVIGGPVVAAIAAVITAAYRIYLGGSGAMVGVAVIVESALLGTVFYHLRRRSPGIARLRNLYGLGVLVHVIMGVLISTLPGGLANPAIREIELVVLSLYPVATVVVCWLLLEDEGRVAVREALVRSEERLTRTIDASGTGMWDWDLTSGGQDVNDCWATMVGLTLEELRPPTFETWTRLVHPDDLGGALAEIARHIAGETPLYSTEFRMRHKDGHWVWVVASGRVTERDASGEPVRMTGTHTDVTGRKEAELALLRSRDDMEQMVLDVAQAMGRIVEARDPYTQGHQQRVATLARGIAKRMGMSEAAADEVEMAGLLHDVGKLHIPSEILTKPGVLSAPEVALIKEHPLRGYEILKDIAFPWPVAAIVLQHHERLDGTGYPNGLAGADITMSARILAVADVVEAMASHRPYRPSLGLEAAMAEVRGFPAKYDRDVVAACVELREAGLIDL